VQGVATSSVEVLWTARYDYKPTWRLAEHEHEYFQMIYIVSGSAAISLAGADHRIEAGTLALIKPHRLHALRPASLVKTLDIKFLVKDEWLLGQLDTSTELIHDCEPGIADLFERIRNDGEHKRPFYRELCSTFLTELLFLYLRSCKSKEETSILEPLDHELTGDWIVEQAVRYIREHHSVDLALSDISRVVRRSDRHVRQHFRDALGMSPRRYLLEYRIQKAQHLIEYSEYALKEIAGMVGFKTIHHFARAFHEICGETPGGWRRKYQAGICKDVNIDPQFVNTNWTVRAEPLQGGAHHAVGVV
jgi:AraC-like DNA-binding protein